MSSSLSVTTKDVPTPSLLVDLDKVKSNCQRMIDRCNNLGVQLRCHMKTQKTLELGSIMTNGTNRCITVSTIKSAQFFADGGFDDILYAYPITENKIKSCQELANKLEAFHLTIDSDYILDLLQKTPLNNGKKWSVFIMVDSGYGRDGVKWDSDEAVEFARKVHNSENVILQGLYAHDGSSYAARGKEQIQEIGGQHASNIAHLAQRLESAGIVCKTVGVGSTPSCSQPSSNVSLLTELHPGNYVFYDAQQEQVGSCTFDDVACRVATRVVGHTRHNNQILIDCGWEGLSLDGKDQLPTGFCVFQGNLKLKLRGMTQELGMVESLEGEMDYDKYPIGSMLYIYPFHACATAAMHPVYYIHEGNEITGTYTPTRGW